MSETVKTSIFEKFVPVLILAGFIMAGAMGYLFNEVNNLKKGTATVVQPDQQPSAPAPKKVELSQIKDLFNKDLIKFGNADSKVLLVEISDPSCPYCHAAGGLNNTIYDSPQFANFKPIADGGTYLPPVPEMKKLVDEGKASFVWIYYPGHGSGELATKALYCAYEKGKFWDVNDLLMTSAGYDLINNVVKNDKAQSGVLSDFLKSANVPDLKACLDSGKYDQRLADDMVIVKSLPFTGTPDFFVNDTNFAGAYSYKDIEKVVTSALQ